MIFDRNVVNLGGDFSLDPSGKSTNSISRDNYEDYDKQYIGTVLNIEKIRVSAANKIRLINLQIKKINELEPNDYESLQYFGSSIPGLNQDGLPKTLKDLENELVDLRTKYTDNDPLIIRLIEKKKLTINLLKSRAIKYLQIAKLEAEAKMESAMRPKGVLLKYRELLRNAASDEKTLFQLESDLRILELQQAKFPDTWKLITKPTLLKNPVAPSKKRISFVGLFLGLLGGILIAIYKENKSDKIYSLQQLEKSLETSLLEIISKNDLMKDSKQINFLNEFLRVQKKKNLSFITLEEVNNNYLQNLREFLRSENNLDAEITIISNKLSLDDCNNSDYIILFTSLKESSLSEINSLKNKLRLLNKDLIGFVLLED